MQNSRAVKSRDSEFSKKLKSVSESSVLPETFIKSHKVYFISRNAASEFVTTIVDPNCAIRTYVAKRLDAYFHKVVRTRVP